MENKSFLSYGYVQLLFTLVLVGVLVALAAYAHLTFKEAKYVTSSPAEITVTGEGEVLAKPDIGQFSFAVFAEGEDADEAQSKSAESVNAILAYLEEEGVAEKDIKTDNYSLNPKYRYEEQVCPADSICPPGERVMDGFAVNQTVMVRVRDLEKAGSLISGVGERGATNVSSLSFTIDDTDALQAEAREKAVADAKENAKVLADALGVRIVRMNGYQEEEGGYYPREYRLGGAFMAEGMDMAVAEMPVGENTITSRVSITYEVR